MAAINDLIRQITDSELREKIQKEVNKLAKQKKFGLVFEDHIPECTPLYDIPIRVGSKVALKSDSVNDYYRVVQIKDNTVKCIRRGEKETVEYQIEDLVCIAEFGEPIYPYLKLLDSVCNAPESDLWNALIEADNYHALQLLEYLYAGKVDCIYIDPPYNTGARDWKYNNDYVDGTDSYRHSKWLSFMEKRLRIAKKLLNPNDSVLIITIDEKEYLHLGCLLEELFPDANMQMISSVINHGTIARNNEFNRNNEYIFFIMIGNYSIAALEDSKNFAEGDTVNWRTLRRTNAKNLRTATKKQFYPIYVDNISKKISYVGDPIPQNVDINTVSSMENCTTVWPIRDDGTEMMWGMVKEELLDRLSKGYVKVCGYYPDKPQKYSLQYLASGSIADIENGKIKVSGYNSDGSVIASYAETRKVMPKTQWDYPTHDARDYGTYTVKNILGNQRFSYPKSLYAVHDSIRLFVLNKPDALILDFFAGSGTTLHAVNLLNAEDGGHRKCILVTNNEVSEAESNEMASKGFKPGDDEWESLGIARYVTWPRTVCSIKGYDINGNKLKGNYIGSDLPMENGFKSNVSFFKLGFLDKTAISLGMRFIEMLPVLWMKAGSHGPCPVLTRMPSDMLILSENKMAVLINENSFSSFAEMVNSKPEIETVYIITDYEINYRNMVSSLIGKTTYQLYRDYLDNFRINYGRR